MHEAIIALGGNMGDTQNYIERAVSMMGERGLLVKKVSRLIVTKAYGVTDQADFLNGACIVETDRAPRELLKVLNGIEADLDRVRIKRWGPRTIDLDIIFYDDCVMQEEDLVIPHRDMQNRTFVLGPVSELAPEKRHPVLNKTVSELLEEVRFREAYTWLEERSRFGVKPGLEAVSCLLKHLGHPEKSCPVLHVAGTNGKGSTCHMLAAILKAAGYKVGLFTSPFLETYRERFVINGTGPDKEAFRQLVEEMRLATEKTEAEGYAPTYFEIITAMSFLSFQKEKTDLAVIETGMGGRLDATNVVDPIASFITPVSLDHRDFLGDTLTAVAGEKAGIIKREKPVFTGRQEKAVMDVLVKEALKKSSPLYALENRALSIKETSPQGTAFTFEGKTYFVPLWGNHQAENASLAIMGLKEMTKQGRLSVTEENIREGLLHTQEVLRLEVLSDHPMVVMDGAHNLHGMRALKKALEGQISGRLLLVIGILKDKDYKEMLREILPLADEVICVSVPNDRTLPAEALLNEARREKPEAQMCLDLKEALTKVLADARPDDTVLCGGSLYLVSELRKIYFEMKKD